MANKQEKRRNRWLAAWANNATYMHYYNYFKNLAINAYTWENMPVTTDVRFLELQLFERGYCLFYKDEIIEKYLTLPCTLSGVLDVYDVPIERRAYASNDYNYSCSNLDSVIIWNNYLHLPTIEIASMYAYKVYELERTIDVNVKGQKHPVLIQCNEKQRLVMQNLYEKYDGNEPFIFGSDTLNVDGISAINTHSPFVSGELNDLKNRYINEFLTLLGIENSYNQKRERMVSDEIGSNYGVVEASRNLGLKPRQEACKAINEMFSLNISVRFSSDLPTLVNGAFNPTLADQHREMAPPEIRKLSDTRQQEV